MLTSLPLFYFNPTICWIDDDQIFLDAVDISFKNKYNCLTIDSPSKAEAFFSQYKSPLSFFNFKREFTESDVFGINNHFPVDINIADIKNLEPFPNKQQEIAVLIIDYNMPTMNGLELCDQLKSFPFKKILLTGDASNEKVIEAFNEGLIDKFIKKDTNVFEKLKCYIDELIYKFFYERSADLISHLQASRESLLTDLAFTSFFLSWISKNNIIEFYLTHRQGNFLVKNNVGQMFNFIAFSEYDKAEFLELNDEIFINNKPLLKLVSDGKLVPFFGIGKESWDTEPKEWNKYFYPAETIHGREKYYWSVITI